MLLTLKLIGGKRRNGNRAVEAKGLCPSRRSRPSPDGRGDPLRNTRAANGADAPGNPSVSAVRPGLDLCYPRSRRGPGFHVARLRRHGTWINF